MSIDPDDADLTAFALGELTGAEAEAMAKVVAASPDAQVRVEEIRSLAGILRTEFRLDPQPAVEKRRSILALLEQGNFWSDWRSASLAAAALLAVCAAVAAIVLSTAGSRFGLIGKGSKPARENTVIEMVETTSPDSAASDSAISPVGVRNPFNTSVADGRTGENPFASAAANPLSSFPIAVETAAYGNIRRSIKSGVRPPREAVQIEGLINYFSYDYPEPEGDRPFSVNVDAATCPWETGHQLVRIGLRGREIANENRAASNLVFLLDVSGSMQTADRLPLIKSAIRLLIQRLTADDRVAIVLYAGASGVALPSTPGDRKEEIVRALDELEAGPLVGGIEGIHLAYQIAGENFIAGGVNRVIVATDGELNVGVANDRELIQVAGKKARSGVALTLLRVGGDAAKSAAMQRVAAKVGGNYAHTESLQNARKVLLDQINGVLATIAKDVEVEVAFNPARVSSYRLIGYESATRRNGDPSNAGIDGSGIAAGHMVTALYQVVPVRAEVHSAPTAPNAVRGESAVAPSAGAAGDARVGPLLTVKLRHKQPTGGESMTTEHSLDGNVVDWDQAPPDFRFAAAVAQFGMILRDSPHKGNGTLAGVLETAEEAKGADPAGSRAGFVELVRQAQALLARRG